MFVLEGSLRFVEGLEVLTPLLLLPLWLVGLVELALVMSIADGLDVVLLLLPLLGCALVCARDLEGEEESVELLEEELELLVVLLPVPLPPPLLLLLVVVVFEEEEEEEERERKSLSLRG